MGNAVGACRRLFRFDLIRLFSREGRLSAALQRGRQSANPTDRIAADVRFGLFDEAMGELQTGFGATSDPAVRTAIEWLDQRVAGRRN